MVSTLKVNKIQIPNSDSDVISLDASSGNVTFHKAVTGAGVLKKIVYVPINPMTPSGGTNKIPIDNTLPQITEGQQVVQYDYSPAATSSTIFVSAYFVIAESSNVDNHHQSALFFNDTCVNARAFFAQPSGDGGMAHMNLQSTFNNTNGNTLDIEIRASQVGTSYVINGQSLNAGAGNFTVGTSSFGGANATNCTYITITEF